MKKLCLLVLTMVTCTIQAQTGSWQWANQATAVNNESGGSSQIFDIARDLNGNVYVVGNYFPNTSFGTSTLSNAGFSDAFVAKYNANGSLAWAIGGHGTFYDHFTSVEIGTDGSVYVGGFSQSPSVAVANYTITGLGSFHSFLVKLDLAGNLVWIKSISGSNNVSMALTTDPSGNIILAGHFTGTISIGSQNLVHQNSQAVFAAGYDAQGNVVSAFSTGSNIKILKSITAIQNSLVIAGEYEAGTVPVFGSTSLTQASNNSSAVFLASLNSTGNVVWAKGYLVSGCGGAALDINGNCYLTGSFSSSVAVFGTHSLSSSPASIQTFLLKSDASGNELWAFQQGSPSGNEFSSGITTDAHGIIYTIGEYTEPMTIGSFTLANDSTTRNVFVTGFDQAGNCVWAVSGGDNFNDVGSAISVSPNSDVYVAGHYWGKKSRFGNHVLLNPSGNTNFFLARIGGPFVGIEESQKADDLIHVYPNPTSGIVSISSPGLIIDRIEVMDVTGRTIFNHTGDYSTVDLRSQPEGVYFIRLFSQNSIATRKIVLH